MKYRTAQMRHMVAFLRRNRRNFDENISSVEAGYLTTTLDMLEDAANQVDALTAERDALKAQLAAVPVEPIRRWYENSNPQMMEYEFIADIETDAESIEAWLETQVTP